jgi:hypothetical protein
MANRPANSITHVNGACRYEFIINFCHLARPSAAALARAVTSGSEGTFSLSLFGSSHRGRQSIHHRFFARPSFAASNDAT